MQVWAPDSNPCERGVTFGSHSGRESEGGGGHPICGGGWGHLEAGIHGSVRFRLLAPFTWLQLGQLLGSPQGAPARAGCACRLGSLGLASGARACVCVRVSGVRPRGSVGSWRPLWKHMMEVGEGSPPERGGAGQTNDIADVPDGTPVPFAAAVLWPVRENRR